MAEASEKKIVAAEIRAILEITDRLYKRDKVRFNKLIVWVNRMNFQQIENEMILKALQALEIKEKNGDRVEYFWPYLNGIVRRMAKQRDHDFLKFGDPTKVSAILAECLRRSQ